MAAPKHRCPVKSCGAAVHQTKLMCLTHWRRVPPELQRNVYQAYRRGLFGRQAVRPFTQAHLAACDAAVRAVEELEAIA